MPFTQKRKIDDSTTSFNVWCENRFLKFTIWLHQFAWVSRFIQSKPQASRYAMYVIYYRERARDWQQTYLSAVLQCVSDMCLCLCIFLPYFNCRWAINSNRIHEKFDIFDSDGKNNNVLSSVNSALIYADPNEQSFNWIANLLFEYILLVIKKASAPNTRLYHL